MKILFLQEQPCIRSLKYAIGLKARQNDVKLYFGYRGSTLSEFYGYGNEFFDVWHKVNGDLERGIDLIVHRVKPDLIHCHNAPDALTVASINILKDDIPIIHDVHDLLSLRKTEYDDGLSREKTASDRIKHEERTAIEGSDGLITVSEAIIEIAAQ